MVAMAPNFLRKSQHGSHLHNRGLLLAQRNGKWLKIRPQAPAVIGKTGANFMFREAEVDKRLIVAQTVASASLVPIPKLYVGSSL